MQYTTIPDKLYVSNRECNWPEHAPIHPIFDLDFQTRHKLKITLLHPPKSLPLLKHLPMNSKTLAKTSQYLAKSTVVHIICKLAHRSYPTAGALLHYQLRKNYLLPLTNDTPMQVMTPTRTFPNIFPLGFLI